MFPGMEAIACPNLAVPAQVMRHVVHVESGANPFAIGVVGGRLVRQPKTLQEAVATAQMLKSKGYNYSLGIAQVNQVNFRKYGFDTHEKAFDPCANLAAGARILASCYTSAGGDWGKAFSCYYSGNFVTGFRTGYVQKIYDSISRGQAVADAQPAASAIPLRAATPAPAVAKRAEAEQPTAAASRISMRVLPFGASAPTATAAAAPTLPAVPVLPSAAPPGTAAMPDVFVPQVRHPSAGHVPAAPAPGTLLDKPAGDGAFVF